VPADDYTTNFPRFFETAAQNGGGRFFGNKVSRNPHDVQGSDRTTAHGKDIGERVGRGDLPVGEWIVHDRGEEIGRLDEGMVAIETENARIIGGGGTDEDVSVSILR
jgi:hypothetical protein